MGSTFELISDSMDRVKYLVCPKVVTMVTVVSVTTLFSCISPNILLHTAANQSSLSGHVTRSSQWRADLSSARLSSTKCLMLVAG